MNNNEDYLENILELSIKEEDSNKQSSLINDQLFPYNGDMQKKCGESVKKEIRISSVCLNQKSEKETTMVNDSILNESNVQLFRFD